VYELCSITLSQTVWTYLIVGKYWDFISISVFDKPVNTTDTYVKPKKSCDKNYFYKCMLKYIYNEKFIRKVNV